MAASFEGHDDVVKMLTEAKAQVNIQDEVCSSYKQKKNLHNTYFHPLQSGSTPLFIASENGHTDIVNTLLQNGADTNIASMVIHACTYENPTPEDIQYLYAAQVLSLSCIIIITSLVKSWIEDQA